MESFRKSLDFLIESKKFKEWKERSNDSYLADFFIILEEGYNLDELNWQIDYYNPKEDLMTSFLIEEGNIALKEQQKVLKQEDHKLKELNLDEVELTLRDAINLVKKKYPEEIPTKIIVVLQKVDNVLWNITFLTNSFKVLNVKVNSQNGNIEEESLKPIFDFKQK